MNNILTSIMNGTIHYLLVVSVTAAVLTLLAWAAVKIVKVRTPVYGHIIWFYTLIAIVVLPVIWLCGPRLTLSVLPATKPGTEAISTLVPVHRNLTEPAQDLLKEAPVSPSTVRETAVVTTTRLEPFFSAKAVIAGLWWVGAGFMVTRLIVGWSRLNRIARMAKPVSNYERLVEGRTRVRLTSQMNSPVCLGLLRPVILLPETMYHHSSSEELRMVLSHELAHIERKDCWTNLFQRLLEAVLFFHPGIWYASFQLTQQREQICDNHVLAQGASASHYVQLLGRIVEQGREKHRLQAVALFEGGLLSRMRSMLDPKHQITLKTSRRAMAVGAMLVLMFLVLGAIRLEAKPPVDSGNPPAPFHDDQSPTVAAGAAEPNVQETLGHDSDNRRPTGDSSIRGKVISAEDGKPVDKASAYLFCLASHDAIFIEPASDGSFEFNNIPSGGYFLSIDAAGYQGQTYDPENKKNPKCNEFSLDAGEQRSGLVFELKRAFTISGKVRDENGQPYSSNLYEVCVWRPSAKDGGPGQYYQLYIGNRRVQPNGSFFIDGLDGSPVYVMAIDWDCANKDDYYPPCYYPGTVSRKEAKLITFDATPSVTNIDITLTKRGTCVLEGVVTDPTGRPIENALVAVHHTEMLFDDVTTYTNTQGGYRIDSIGPGDYLVHVDAEPFGYVRSRQPVTIESGTRKVDFTLTVAAKISGTIVDEFGKPMDVGPAAFGGASLIEGVSGDGNSSWSGRVNKFHEKYVKRESRFFYGGQGDYHSASMDFPTPETFVICGLAAGKTTIYFQPQNLGLEVKSIIYNGQDILRSSCTNPNFIETKSGEEINGVTIVVGAPTAPGG